MSGTDSREALIPFGRYVRGRREQLRLSVQQVATALDLAPVSIYKIESGSRRYMGKLDKYAEVLQCDVAELRRLQPHRTPVADTVKRARANSKATKELQLHALEIETKDTKERELLVATQQLFRRELLEPFTEVASRIDGLQAGLDGSQHDETLAAFSALDEGELHQWTVVASALGQMAAATGAGVVVGGLAAFSAFTGMAALGTASTGAAIASLSGAAETSATLAALGGGSLAVGGWGVVGGTALLAGLVAAPALVAAGIGAFFADRYAYRKLVEQGDSLDDARAKLSRIEKELTMTWSWADRQRKILNELRAASSRPLSALEASIPGAPAPRREWSELGGDQPRVRFLTLVISTAIEAMNLPTWPLSDETSMSASDVKATSARYAALAKTTQSLLRGAPE
ncbi:MAG: hypothetical protein QG597_2079 [Actinomycetota bacterium]|nr:hypothetical protein [Actinomycetota bacterium]